jgi:hypothetical protein
VLAGCSDLDAGLLSDAAALATATACGCAPYGSYPHTTPSATPTPTGTWVPPTDTPRPTPTRAAPCDFCTLVPAPTAVPPHWPPPIITCTPRPDQPTLSPVPTAPPALFPTFPPNTPIPAVIGDTNPAVAASLEGEALPGGVATDAHTGRPAAIWSQLNPDAGQEPAGRVYLQLTDPASGQWLPPRTVNEPGQYKIGKGPPESAVGLASDGTLYVVYVRLVGDNAVLEWRMSADSGATWSPPVALAYPSSNQEIYNLRLVMDATGQPHITAVVVQVGGDEADPSGDIVYYERLPDGAWRQERRPVDGQGARQFSQAVTTFTRSDGTIRTVLGWNEGQVVYSSYKDGPAGAWSAPQPIIDGNSHPDGIPDYEAGFGGTLRLLPFSAGGQDWVYFFWTLYSTGRICYVYSTDGGAHWSREDALAYNPIVPIPPPPAPFVPPVVYGTVHEPIPLWDGAQQQVFVLYQFCDRSAARAGCYVAYAYAPPGAAGTAWVGREDSTHEPLRLFRSTLTSQAATLRSSEPGNAGSGSVWLIWQEATGARELYRALVSPATLLSGTVLP